MSNSQFSELICNELESIFDQKFKQSNLSERHYSFSSSEYDFSFSVALYSTDSAQSLVKKVNAWLGAAKDSIQPNNHYLFSENGEMWKK
jgi:hypothetical protein